MLLSQVPEAIELYEERMKRGLEERAREEDDKRRVEEQKLMDTYVDRYSGGLVSPVLQRLDRLLKDVGIELPSGEEEVGEEG